MARQKLAIAYRLQSHQMWHTQDFSIW